MKNVNILLSIALCGCVALASCDKSESGAAMPNVGNEVRFGSVQSRAAAAVESFTQGDNIYIASAADASAVETVGAENLYKVTSANGIESEDPIFWTDNTLSFYAVNQDLQPNADATRLVYDVATAQEELLWLSMLDKTRTENESTPIAIKFRRCLSEAVVKVAFTGVYESVNPDLEIYFKANSSFEFNPWAASFAVESVGGKPASDDYAAEWSKAAANSSTNYSLLMMPQTLDASSEIVLVVKDSEGDAVKQITAASKDIRFESGKRTTINITINKNANTATVVVGEVSVEEFETAEMNPEDQLIVPNHEE